MRHRIHHHQGLAVALVALVAVLAPTPALAEPQVSPILYLNRCKGGCVIHGGVDDARAMTSSIPCPGGADCSGGGCRCNAAPVGDFTLDEYKDAAGNVGAAADAEWNELVHCVREMYSPYAITVTDQLPPGGLSHNQNIVAGRSSQIGLSAGGVSPGTNCAPRDNIISFTFANQFGGTGQKRIWELCGVIGQEASHAYGLDHAFKFSDGRPACSDPLTYLPSCGQKFFRNDNATCGEFAERNCKCGGFQNSHLKILAVFGPGTPITTPPVASMTLPVNGATIGSGAVVTVKAKAQRGVARLDLWLNGYKWTSVKGVGFGSNGQPEASYSLLIPTAVPNSIIDIVVKVYDDIEVETVLPAVTVTKGAACADASACALGQSCENGRCFWAEPVGAIGETCEYEQFCISGLCVETSDGRVCSQGCVVGVEDSCPVDYTCEGPPGETGFCLLEGEKTGCCSVGGDRRGAMALSLAVLALVLRRRRRRC